MQQRSTTEKDPPIRRVAKMARRLAQRFGWGRLFALAVLAAFLALRAWDAAPLQLMRLKTFDLYQLAKPRVPTTRPVAIVDIDEASLNSLGQWPWPRPLVAKLIDQITAAKPAVIGFDIVFPEPDRTSPALLAETLPDLSPSAREELTRQPSHDQILAQSIARSRVVLGQSAHNPYKGVKRTQEVPKAPFATVGGDPRPYLVRFPELLGNIPELEKSAAGRGMFTIESDRDGILRRVPMVLIAHDTIVPSLTLDMLRVAAGQSAFLVRSDPGGVESVVVAGARIPTDAWAQVWVYFAPHDAARFISAKDVISGSAAPRLAGKLVLVGTSASGLLDLKTTPIQPSMPGVEVNAQILENVLGAVDLVTSILCNGGGVGRGRGCLSSHHCARTRIGRHDRILNGCWHCRVTGWRRMVFVLDPRISVRRVLPSDLLPGRDDGNGVHELLPRGGAATADQERFWPVPFAGPSGGIGRASRSPGARR